MRFLKNSFFIGLLLSTALLWPLVVAPYFSHHDDVQTIRLYEMHQCFKDGQFPCRWVPDLGEGYGYPLFNFYAPLPYYIGEIFYSISQNLIFSAKMMFGLSFLGAYVFMYLLGRKLWGSWGGLLSGVFYSYAPYHAVDFYVRGAMGEMWALVWFPACLWSLLRLKEERTIFNSLLLGLFIACLFLSHNLSAMIFMPFLFLFFVYSFVGRRSVQVKSLMSYGKYFLVALAFGLALSFFYWLPAYVEKPLVHVETTTYGYFSYTEHFKGFRKLFLDYSWGWGASVREVPGGPRDGISYQIGWVHLLALIMVLIGMVLKKELLKQERYYFLIICFISLSISIFMIHPLSVSVWGLFEQLKFLQFPWRFLALVIFFTSIIVGSLPLFFNKYRFVVLTVLIALVVIFNGYYFRPEKFVYVTDQQLLTGENWDRLLKRSIYDYLPIYAEAPPAEVATVPYELLTGETIIHNYAKGTDWITFDTETKSHSILRLSQYYFPDWKVFIDGKEVKIDYKNPLGLITFILGVGAHHVEARLFDSPVRTIANSISVVSLLLFVVLFSLQIPKTRKVIIYCLKEFYR